MLKMPVGYPVGGAVGSWVGKSEARGGRGQESAYRFGNHALIYGIEGHGLAEIVQGARMAKAEQGSEA